MVTLPVKKPSTLAGLYEDGEPVGDPIKPDYSGDGTVPWDESAMLDNIVATGDVKAGSHSGLVGAFAQRISDFLDAGRTFPAMASKGKVAKSAKATKATSVLSVTVRSRAAAFLTNAAGQRCGIDDSTQQIYKEIPGSAVVRDPSGGSITVPDPTAGTYTLTLNGLVTEEAYITATYMDAENSEELQQAVYYSAMPKAIQFSFSQTQEPKIQLKQTPAAPTNLTAIPYDQDGVKTGLTWTAVTDPHLTGYRIYSRQDNEPVLKLLATVSSPATTYNTGQAWDDPRRVYAVSAINSDGSESFLSNYAQNRSVALANFSATPLTGTAPLKVQFTDASSGEVTSWLWDFGDGETSTDQNPKHTYDQAGEYTVKLTIQATEGADLEIKNAYIYVTEKEPCPSEKLLETQDKKNGKNEARKGLDLLRAFRDSVLAGSESGQRLISLYYHHSQEMNAIMAGNPSLMLKTGRLLLTILPAIKDAIKDQGRLVLAKGTLADIYSLIGEYKKLAGKKLGFDLERVKRFLKAHGKEEGKTRVAVSFGK